MNLTPEQEAIRAKCFHPSGIFVEFPMEDVDTSIPERFEKIVRAFPGRIAVKMGDRALTYDKLNRITNRIAHAIVKKTGSNKEPIALLFEDFVDGIIASLAALKAGKFSIALDPSWPLTKLAHILADSNATAILSNDHQFELAERLSNNVCPALHMSEIDDLFSSEDLCIPIAPDDIAAISYTSGSTGDPKGVVETHRTRLYSAMVMSNLFHICENDKLNLVHSLSYSTGRFQCFRALLNGAALMPFDIKADGVDRMAKWIRDEEITILYLPIAVFRQFAECVSGGDRFRSVRIVHVSGAHISQGDFELYKKKLSSGPKFVFHMGSTEACTVCCCIADHNFSAPEEGSLAGYPVPGKEVHIVGDDGQDVAPGEVGEIVVKSRYLTAGYWGQPELTRAKFLSDPSGSNKVIYFTGDLGKKQPDGFVTHMGRKDSMVKIKGFRVEPGEIERVLRTHPEIKDVSVVPWDGEDGEQYLAAYLIPNGGHSLVVRDLRRFLHGQLSEYMIPSSFNFLEILPLTPNGKVDRKALPAPDRSRPQLDAAFVAPRNPTEQKLVEIWSDVLSLDGVGIYDNFFDLGGHSLAASRVVSYVIKHFGLEIPLSSLFSCPTVVEMAKIITEHQGQHLSNDEMQKLLAEVESLLDEDAVRLMSETGQRDSKN